MRTIIDAAGARTHALASPTTKRNVRDNQGNGPIKVHLVCLSREYLDYSHL